MRGFSCHRLRDYVRANVLSESLPHEMEAHVAGCSSCRLRWDRLTRMSHLLTEDAERNLLPLFHEEPGRVRLMERISAKETPQLRPSRVGFRRLTSFVAVTAGAAGLIFLLSSLHRPSPSTGPKEMQASAGQTISLAPNTKKHIGTLTFSPMKPTSKRFNHSLKNISPSFPKHSNVIALSKGAHPVPSVSPPQTPVSEKEERPRNQRPFPSLMDDLAYINTSEEVRARQTSPSVSKQEGTGDDFITVPLPQVALGNQSSSSKIITQAVEQYQKEKAIVDPRLAQPVTVAMKGGDLEELAETLTQRTGVRFYARKDLEDIKLTVLVKNTPIRDLMRQVVKLFNLEWRRAGEEGKYRYTLVQTLKQRLAEEEKRRKDQDEILLNIHDQLDPYTPYLDSTPEQMKAFASAALQQAESAGNAESRERFREQRRIFEILSHPLGLDALKLFISLTPDQLVELRNEGKVVLPFDGTPESLSSDVVKHMQQDLASSDLDFHGYKAEEVPAEKIHADVQILMDPTRSDKADLEVIFGFGNRDGGPNPGTPVILTTGVPQVFQSNRLDPRQIKLDDDRLTALTVSLDPKPNHPLTVKEDSPLRFRLLDLGMTVRQNFNGISSSPDPDKPAEWVDSGDVWAEVHQKTGLNIVSDYYLRVYPRSRFVQAGKLKDVLVNAANELKAGVQAEVGFLRLRRLNYYSERTMDVPNRLLRKWSEARKRKGYLNLEELAEMSELPKSVFWDEDLHRAVLMKWELMEWKAAQYAQDQLRLFAALTPGQKNEIQSDQGLKLSSLSNEQMKGITDRDFLNELKSQPQGRLFMRLREPGWYIWRPLTGEGIQLYDAPIFPGQEPIREKEKAAAQAKAAIYVKERGLNWRKSWPLPEEMVKGPGASLWICFPKDGKYRVWDDWYDR